MPQNPPVSHFDEERAARYDERFARLAPLREALHLLTALALEDLPTDARVLVVGAGTGAEVLALAARFPDWRFVAVDPSAPMLAICRERVKAAGLVDRCEFHEGLLSGLNATAEFHAATSILVSQFVTSTSERIAFFREIATRLVRGGRLITADLSTGAFSHQHPQRLEMWRTVLRYSGLDPDQIAQTLQAYGRDVAVLPAAGIETLLGQGGFANPVLISQNLLIHAWLARRGPPTAAVSLP